jgi:hypothetical protein
MSFHDFWSLISFSFDGDQSEVHFVELALRLICHYFGLGGGHRQL